MTKRLNPAVLVALIVIGVGGLGLGLGACGSSNGSNGSSDDGGSDSTTDTGKGPDATGDGHPGDGPGGDGSGGDGGNVTDAGLGPEVFAGDGGCFTLGSGCTSSGECCSNDCVNGVCGYPPCTSDGLACATNGNCCGQSCVNNVCAALNPTCKTLGNACAGSGDCCSGNCSGLTCQPSSFCGQIGDSCSTGADCCSKVCDVAAGQALGTCGDVPPGSANCKLTDGMLCSGTTNDGGIVLLDGGIPTCGGGCCSRSCAPWGPTGILVCQPAGGCRPVGDTCYRDDDCCGSAAYPSDAGGPQSMGGYSTCSASDGGVGVCGNPNGCKPNGAVCRLKTMSCNSSCDCCSGNCHADTCKQDNLGVPRCSVSGCLDAGGACASSADCCNANPCVPSSGAPGAPLTCSPFQCIQSCGMCTNNADCCPGSNCLNGVCDPCGGPPGDGGSPGDGGGTLPDGSGLPPDGGAPPPPDGGCALFGQLCTTSSECCNAVPCTSGRCEFPAQ